VTRIFTDYASGGRWDRPELHRALDHLLLSAIIPSSGSGRCSAHLRQ
jgi:hypothetical protein